MSHAVRQRLARTAARALAAAVLLATPLTLDTACSSCQSGCLDALGITVRGLDANHRYEITIAGDSSVVVSCSQNARSLDLECSASPASVWVDLSGGELKLTILGTPARLDLAVARDGSPVAGGRYEPAYSESENVCKAKCENATIALSVPRAPRRRVSTSEPITRHEMADSLALAAGNG